MQTVHSREHIEQKFGCDLWLEPACLFQSRIKVSFLCKLHDEVNVLLIFEVGQQLDNVGMVESRHDVHFVSELAHHFQLLYHFFLDHFQCVFLFALFAEHTHDFSVGALAESFVYFEVPETQRAIYNSFKRRSGLESKLALQ